jgi:hypothetical protein
MKFMAAYREPFPDDFDEIEPRIELEPAPEPQPLPNPEPQPLQKTVVTVDPVTVKVRAPEARAITAKGNAEHNGPSECDVLLQCIIVLARREPVNRAALRTLCVRFTREHALTF